MRAGDAKRGGGRLLLVAAPVAAIAVFIGAELAVRAVLALRGEPGPDELRAELAALVDGMTLPVGASSAAASSATVPHPYLAWETPEGLERHARRAEYFASPEAEQRFDVLVLGGAAALDLADGGRRPFRTVLEEDSELLAERELRIHVLADPGHKQPQQLNLLNYVLSLGWKPDLVIEVDGFNELALGHDNLAQEVHPLNPDADRWRHLDQSEGSDGSAMDYLLDAWRERELARRALGPRTPLGASALLSLGARGQVELHRKRFEEALQAFDSLTTPERPLAVFGPPKRYGPGLLAGQPTILRSWVESSVAMRAVCAARGISYLHVLQPAPSDGQRRGLANRELFVSLGYDRFRELGAELRARDVVFFDGTGVFPRSRQSPRWPFRADGLDEARLNEEAIARLAERVAGEVARLGAEGGD